MIKRNISSALSLLLGVSAISANAADVTLEVNGWIQAEACSLNITNGGVFDYGDITLAATGTTLLPEKSLPFTVTCAVPTLVALNFMDNRADSVGGAQSTDGREYGLGFDKAGNPIGFTLLQQNPNPIIDGVTGTNVQSRDGGVTWTSHSATICIPTPDFLCSVSDVGGTTDPTPYSSLTGAISTRSMQILPKSDLDTSREINLDGSATVSLVYL